MFPVGAELIGDVPAMLEQLAAKGAGAASARWRPERLGAHRTAIRDIVRPRQPSSGISPAALMAAVNARVTDELLLTVDVGAHRILACHAIDCVTPGQLLQSNGLGCMGYAIPAAIGASLASGRRVIALVGDGSALMSLGELAVVAEHRLPVVVVILNDASLALIELKQSKLNVATGAVRFKAPDFALLGRGFGLASGSVADLAAFEAALDAALTAEGPSLIEAHCDRSEYWEQM